MRKLCAPLTVVAVVGLLCGAALAATITWNGEGTTGAPPSPDSSWSNTGNWIGGTVPGATDSVVVADTTPQSTSIADASGPGMVNALRLGAGMTLTVNKTLVVDTDLLVAGSVTVNGSNQLSADFIRIGGGDNAASLTYSGSNNVLVKQF